MSKEIIEILLLEDDTSIAESYRDLWPLKYPNLIGGVHIAKDEKEFFDALESNKSHFNLFVLDLSIKGNPIKGLNILRKLDVKNESSLYHDIPVTVLTARHNELNATTIKSIWRSGAKGIFGKDLKSDELITNFKKIVFDNAELLDSPSIRKIVYSDKNNSYINDITNLFHLNDDNLTDRQQEILRYWCAGWTTKEIASETKITKAGVEGHFGKIREKCYPLHSPLEIFLTILTHNLDETTKDALPEFINDIFNKWNTKITMIKSKRDK